MHRLRGGEPLSPQDRLPQAWVPRVVNASLAALLLLFLVPVFLHLGDVGTGARVMLLFLAVPFVLLTLACLASALRPGSLGIVAGRVRARRSR